VVIRFLTAVAAPGKIPFDFAQGRLSLRLKSGCARDDALMGVVGSDLTAAAMPARSPSTSLRAGSRSA
jgi:hypothetical protein